jgi:two-component system sensor histidine kinase YesM
MRNIFRNASIRDSILLPVVLIVVISLITSSYLTFINFKSTSEEIGESSSKEINKQIILNFENYIESVIDTADYIQQKTIEQGLKDENETLEDIYGQAADVQPDIESIVLFDLDGNPIVNSSFKDITTDDITLKDWYIDALSVDSIYHFSSPHQQDVFNSSNAEVITVTKIVDYYVAGEKSEAVLVVDINTSSIIQLTETTNLGEGGHIVILNDDDTLIYSDLDVNRYNLAESITIAQDIFRGESVKINDITMYVNASTLQDTRWVLATFINTELVEQASRQNLIIVFIITVSTLIVTLVATSLIANGISRPINKLKNHMQLIESGNFYQLIEISGQKEVVVLAHSFNAMIEEIKSLMEKVLIEQKEKRETELQALQNQINPHFLYNTLDSIVYLSENKQNEKVVEMVIALSRFFRISISRGKNIISLKEELEHARNYLLIQQIRYLDKFDFVFEVEEQVLQYKTVKLSLQPLIENAIYHGINTEYGAGKITIRAFLKEDMLVLEVEDDGYGIPDDEIEVLYQQVKYGQLSKSVGLRNVYQRLKIYYGDTFEFVIDSELDEKTIFRLVVPKERAK